MLRLSLSWCVGAAFGLALASGWGQSALGQPQGKTKPKGRKHALLVGVDGYGRDSLLPRLNYAGRDADELARTLLDCGYAMGNIVVMTSKTGGQNSDLLPTADRIRNQLDLLYKTVDENDTLLVLLSGHGVTIETPALYGKPAERTVCFCPSDADLRVREPSRFIALASVYEGLKTCKASTKLLLVDACRVELKGALPRGISMLTPPSPPRSVAALFACGEGEVSCESPSLDGGHGVFTHFVIEGLVGAADSAVGHKPPDGAVSLEELAGFVRENVLQNVRKEHESEQTPQLLAGSDGAGRLVLVDAPGPGASPSITSQATGVKLNLIPAGEFWMGSTKEADPEARDDELPRHRVQITRPFYLGVTEVTVGQFRKGVSIRRFKTEAERDGVGGFGWNEQTRELDGPNPRYTWRFTGLKQADDHPVVNVTWNDALWFCNELSRLEGLVPYYQTEGGRLPGGDGYRLPTEAEWEYACRARTTMRYPWGDERELPAEDRMVSVRDTLDFTSPVTRFRANAFGLYGMNGNVSEWCRDGYDKDYYARSPAADPVGAEGAPERVIRGGPFLPTSAASRSADRSSRVGPYHRSSGIGFRVARGQSGR